MTLIDVIGAVVAQTDPGTVDAIPLGVQLGVAGIFVWLLLRLYRDTTQERKDYEAALAAARQQAAVDLAAERQANRETLRAINEAHAAELSRERDEAKRLYDRLLDKVIPTLEATVHALNEVRAMERDRPPPRGPGGGRGGAR